jgi:N-formylglutamate amidohydrolase
MSTTCPSSLQRAKTPNPDVVEQAVSVCRPPDGLSGPVILASPHSGRHYADDLQADVVLPLELLRRSEDAYVDQLIDCAPEFGATTICAEFPRVFVDVNRGPWDLDPRMFADSLPEFVNKRSKRAASGLGVVPRIGANGHALYRRQMRFADARARLTRYYTPYQNAIKDMLTEAQSNYGIAILLDMHSMPHVSAPGVDFVLGDRFGQSCDHRITDVIEGLLRESNFVTVRNTPYAGGHTTEFYGAPQNGIHVIQIEMNRSLYLDEHRVVRSSEWSKFKNKLDIFIKRFCAIEWVDKLPS